MSPLDKIKQQILKRSIDEDQNAIATQWLKTLLHNDPKDAAIRICQLVLASISQGDFKTRAMNDPQLTAPNDVLTLVDYLSHASRIIIDYQSLSAEYQNELLAFFPPANENGVMARSSTHAVVRNPQGIKELKGFHLGLKGQLPALLNRTKDFGINIAMGGEGQSNFMLQTITKNGYSGHLFFHRNDEDALLMVGLEQSAPAKSILSFLDLFVLNEEAHEIQQHTDQFEQGHSIIGSSDVYTAAGSLYFSDPIYQAKLLVEKKVLPPQKYGGMLVAINNDNWPKIKQFFNAMRDNISNRSAECLFKQLSSLPSTNTHHESCNLPHIAIDFKTYLQHCLTVFVPEGNDALNEQQAKLFSRIKRMQNTTNQEEYELLHTQLLVEIQALLVIANQLPSNKNDYIQAILRIEQLFIAQLNSARLLTREQKTQLFEEQIDDAERTITELIHHLEILQGHVQQSTVHNLILTLKNAQSLTVDDNFIMVGEEQLVHYQQLITEAKGVIQQLTPIETPELRELRAQLQDANAQLQDANAQLQDANAQLQDVNAQLQDVNAQLQDVNAQLQDVNAQLQDANAQLELLTAHNHALQSEVQTMRDDKRLNDLQVQNREQELDRLRQQQAISNNKVSKSFLKEIDLRLLSAFSAALGALSVAIAVCALSLGTGGSAVLIMSASAGALTCFLGGFFYYKAATQESNAPPEQSLDEHTNQSVP